MRLYLLLLVFLIVPIALNYGLRPGTTLPQVLDITVSGTDQVHVFRALMCLYLGAAVFWAIAAFTPSWQRTAVIWGIFFAFSLAIGRVISLIVDGARACFCWSIWGSRSRAVSWGSAFSWPRTARSGDDVGEELILDPGDLVP